MLTLTIQKYSIPKSNLNKQMVEQMILSHRDRNSGMANNSNIKAGEISLKIPDAQTLK
jgi:hypothetical protein